MTDKDAEKNEGREGKEEIGKEGLLDRIAKYDEISTFNSSSQNSGLNPETSKEGLGRLEVYVKDYYKKVLGRELTDEEAGEKGSAQRALFYSSKKDEIGNYFSQEFLRYFSRDPKRIVNESEIELRGLAKIIGSNEQMLKNITDENMQEHFINYASIVKSEEQLETLKGLAENYKDEKEEQKKKKILELILINLREEKVLEPVLDKVREIRAEQIYEKLGKDGWTGDYRLAIVNAERERYVPKNAEEIVNAFEQIRSKDLRKEFAKSLKIKTERKAEESDKQYQSKINEEIDNYMAKRAGEYLVNEVTEGTQKRATEALVAFYKSSKVGKSGIGQRTLKEIYHPKEENKPEN